MNEINIVNKEGNKPSPKEIVYNYLPYAPWLVLSLLVALTSGFILLRYSTPTYTVKGKVLVKDKNPYGNNSEKFSNIFMLPDDNSNLNNEIEIIKSSSMALRTVKALGLQQAYAIKGSIRTSEAHISDVPFNLEITKILDSSKAFSCLITILNNTQFRINEDPALYNFNQYVTLPQIQFRLVPYHADLRDDFNKQYLISWGPELAIAIGLSQSLNVERSEGASVLNISVNTYNVKNGVDIINQYMKEYLKASMEDKKQIAYNTVKFIDEQLDTVQRELGGVERNLQNFREKNNLFNPEGQAQIIFEQLGENAKSTTVQQIKLRIINDLITYVSSPANADKLVPSNLGIEEPSLVDQILAYNKMQLQRETTLKTTPAANQVILNMETGIEKLRQDIHQNLLNIKNSYTLALNEFSQRAKEVNSSIKTIPGKEKALLEVTRRQSILQELYSFLLQKKLETAISSASTISDISILEPAMSNNLPVTPNKKLTYILAFLLGLGIPVGIIFLRGYLNDKVESRNDIETITQTPILGEVGHASDTNSLVVKQNDRNYIGEQFRIIRSNLQYILPKQGKPVILVTSSFSGEGKSFISTNLGAVLALSGKRIVVMEMDIRKPKILKGLGMNEKKGFSNYIVGNIEISDIIYNVPDVDNLFVMPCGPMPPNPGEMLLNEKVADLFNYLKNNYDAIIIDSAPIGLVSDAVLLAAHANASVYIVRHNYTLKKHIELVDSIYQQKKLPALSIVINDIHSTGNYGNYYGYGYGYGYGSKKKYQGGYFEKEESKRWWDFFSKRN